MNKNIILVNKNYTCTVHVITNKLIFYINFKEIEKYYLVHTTQVITLLVTYGSQGRPVPHVATT